MRTQGNIFERFGIYYDLELKIKDTQTINYMSFLKKNNLSYLGNTNNSAKIAKNGKKGVSTYIIYLSPSTQSGYNVCPKATPECIAACLSESGYNRIDTSGRINRARISKTQLFFSTRTEFVDHVAKEIANAEKRAKKAGLEFSVRLNGTSDLSPILFKGSDGLILLEKFPHIQFYDYTKVLSRVKLLQKYVNYDLTFSYSGSNWDECKQALDCGMRVAVVFAGKQLPATYKGLLVVDGDVSDIRYWDPKDCIVGLRFKKVRNKIENSSFVVSAN